VRVALTTKATHFGMWVSSTRNSRRGPWSSNQIGGLFSRLEASHKHFFGSVGVLGTRNNSIITGALIACGQEIRPVVEIAPDWEGYTYERINLDNTEQKAFFEASLAWDLEVQLGTRSG